MSPGCIDATTLYNVLIVILKHVYFTIWLSRTTQLSPLYRGIISCNHNNYVLFAMHCKGQHPPNEMREFLETGCNIGHRVQHPPQFSKCDKHDGTPNNLSAFWWISLYNCYAVHNQKHNVIMPNNKSKSTHNDTQIIGLFQASSLKQLCY